MGIIIRQIDEDYFIESVHHTPFNFTPFTNPDAIQDFCYYMKIGKLKKLDGLELDKEYPYLDCYKDFDVIERIPQVEHENGLVYDDLIYELKNKI